MFTGTSSRHRPLSIGSNCQTPAPTIGCTARALAPLQPHGVTRPHGIVWRIMLSRGIAAASLHGVVRGSAFAQTSVGQRPQRCTDVGQTTAAVPQPGLWHRSNRTAACARTASWGRSSVAAALRQAHRTASCGGSDPVTAAQLSTTRRCSTGTPHSDAGSTDQNVSRDGSRITTWSAPARVIS